jgi:hypothetical protein
MAPADSKLWQYATEQAILHNDGWWRRGSSAAPASASSASAAAAAPAREDDPRYAREVRARRSLALDIVQAAESFLALRNPLHPATDAKAQDL